MADLTNLQGSTPVELIEEASGNSAAISATGAVKVDGSAAVQPVVQVPPFYSTYAASIVGLAPAATPTDFFTITGSATKTIIITRLSFSATQTLAGVKDIVLLKRSTANTGGTSSTPTVVPYDSVNAAGTAVIRAYTVNPTLGTLVGNIHTVKTTVGAAGTVSQPIAISVGEFFAQGLTLRGTSQVVALNGNSVSFGAGISVDCFIEWVEF